MIIDFPNMQEEAKPNFKGGEKEYNVKMTDIGPNKFMRGRLVPGASIGFHTHTENQEIIYALEGEGTVVDENGCTVEVLEPGQAHYCAKGASHSLVNKSDKDLIFFAVVTTV